MKTRRSELTIAALAIVLSAAVGSCGANIKGLPGGISTDIPDKYEAYINKCEAYEKDVEEAKQYIEQTPKELAAVLDLKEDATLQEVTDAIRARIQKAVVKAGAHVEITIEGGIEAGAMAEAGTGGASAEAGVSAEVKVTITVVGKLEVSPELQELLDAGKLALERIIGSAKKLKALAEQAPDLIQEGADLTASVSADIQNPATAAQVTAKIAGFSDMFKEVSGLFDVSFEMQVEVKASFTLEASGEASAG